MMVGTVKKSVDTIWPTWLCKKVFHVWLGGRRSLRRMRETVRSEMANAEHLELAVNPGCTPQWIGSGHLCNQAAEFCCGAGATSTAALRLGKPGPESPEPLALPAHNGVCLDVKQGPAPVAPQTPEGNPEHPVKGRQQRTLSLSLKGR